MEELLERKVTREELRKFFATECDISKVLNSVIQVSWSYSKPCPKKEDLTVRNLYGYFNKSLQTYKPGFRGIGRKSMSNLDKWARSLGLEETPYFLKHLPIVGENPVLIEMGKLRLDTWDENVSPCVFVAGLEGDNLVYCDADLTYFRYPKPEGDLKRASFDQVLDYRRNGGALAERAIRDLSRS